MVQSTRYSLIGALLLAAGSALVGAVFSSPSAHADGGPPLPDEAFAACQSKNAGDACSLKFRDRDLHGICAPHPADGRLFCLPEPPPIPPAAFDACNGKNASDGCSVQIDGQKVEGTCMVARDSRLFCAPPHPPGPPPVDNPSR
jgi:hypothetical protein